jgi:hypothetical protein
VTNHNLKQMEREFWGELAASQDPEFFLSVTLKRNYADSVTIDAFKFAMRAIQRRIPCRRAFRGVASLERTWKNSAFEGQLHLHAILWGVVGHVSQPEKFMKDVVTSSFMKLRDSRKRLMTRRSNINLQDVYDPGGASRYTTKDLAKSTDRKSRIWLITDKGFDTSTDYFQ